MRRWWRRRKSGNADEEVTKSTAYDVGEFAIKHGLTSFDARRLLRESSHSREEADAAALRDKLHNATR